MQNDLFIAAKLLIKMPKLLFIGDPHFRIDNIPEVNLFIERLEKLTQDEKPDLICIGGDLLHTHERLHTIPLNKAYELVERMRAIAKTFVLVGNHDMCFSRDTPILMWDGTTKMSQDICIGDVLCGDNSTSRKVLSLTSGTSLMYEIVQQNGQSYTVNENHILSLRADFHKSMFWDADNCHWTVKWLTEDLKLKSRMFLDKEQAKKFLDTIRDNDNVDISVKSYLKLPRNVKERLYGYRVGVEWEERPVKLDPYILGLWLGNGCGSGKTFTSTNITIINHWEDWARENGAEITHNEQYNFQIRLQKRGKPLGTESCRTCKACIEHKEKYGRSPLLACASTEEISLLLSKDPEIHELLSTGASNEQIAVLNNETLLRSLLKRRKSEILPKQRTFRKNSFVHILNQYNLINNKHIPRDYIVNSRQNRMKLLAGLVDSDCRVHSETHRKLMENIVFLCRSLEFSAHRGTSDNIEKIIGKNCTRTEIKIIPKPKERYYGWAVDKNQRFLLNDFTVVHNCNNQQFLTTNHWMNGMKEWNNVVVVDKVVHHYLEDVHLVFAPYVSPGRFQEALNSSEEDWQDADCIFAHQEFFGCKMGAIVSVEGDKWSLDYPEVVSGHIHSKQSPQANIYYSGSAMQHAFGESEQNIIAVLTWEGAGEKYKLMEHDLHLPRKRIIYKDVAAMEEYVPEQTDDKVKITISGVYDEFKAFKKTKKYRELIKSGKKVVFKPKRIAQKKDDQKLEQPMDETDFNNILINLVNSERNSYLFQVHELVVRNRKISKDDVFFPPT